MADRIMAWAPALGWAALLYLLSSLPDLPGPGGIPFGDKLGHFVLYGVLGTLLALGRRRSGGSVPHLLLLALGALWGLSDEWHQSFVPGRTPDWADLLADIAGLLTGYGLMVVRGAGDESNETNETKGTA